MLEWKGVADAGSFPVRRLRLPLQAADVSDPRSSCRRPGEILAVLEGVVGERREASPERSYTSRLLAGGVPAIGAKVTEEAEELVRAAAAESADRVVSEAADLIYHVLVLLASRDVPLSRVEGELAGRFGVAIVEQITRAGLENYVAPVI